MGGVEYIEIRYGSITLIGRIFRQKGGGGWQPLYFHPFLIRKCIHNSKRNFNRNTSGWGGGSFLPIPVEFLYSYQARHLYGDVITIATMVKMTKTPYNATDQNSISMTPFVKTIIILNVFFLVRQSSYLPSNWRRNEPLFTVRGGGGTQTFKSRLYTED